MQGQGVIVNYFSALTASPLPFPHPSSPFLMHIYMHIRHGPLLGGNVGVRVSTDVQLTRRCMLRLISKYVLRVR